MSKRNSPHVARRSFLKGAGLVGAAALTPAAARAQVAAPKHELKSNLKAAAPGPKLIAADTLPPGTLWTVAHHRIPMLYVVLNNRAYHQEYMHLQAMAGRRSRGVAKTDIGTTLKVYGEGPISDPNELAPALKRALAVVKRGEPAVVDVVSEPR
jgi:Thiamine pyrophosphate enzyme, C-terminal TPP binding domain/TAT (twin-arginine translocation) pathway signal sequence